MCNDGLNICFSNTYGNTGDITHEFVEVGAGHCTEGSIGGGEESVAPFFVQELGQACSLNVANQSAVQMRVKQYTLLGAYL